jgi:hypothetical protein
MARKLPRQDPIDVLPDVLADEPERDQLLPPGSDVRSIGPSDSSDSGSDVVGLGNLDSTTDRYGTGERASAELDDQGDLRPDADIVPDRVVEAEQAGLGGGLDQAEEAQLGITDEEIDALEDDED